MITDAISSGITYLQTQQQTDGSFLSLSSPSSLSFQKAFTFHSVFSTALILSCLNNLKDSPMLQEIKQKAASFLLSEKSEHWSFNYWVRGSKETKEMPYPDDLDDTFCALSALYQYDPKLIDGAAMAEIIMLLTTLEEKEGGPYRTWLVPESADKVWKDIDLVVNSNIAYFLSLQEIDLPNVNQFIESHIENSLTSPYYPTVFPLIYFISRFYHGDKISKLTDIILVGRDRRGNWGNSLESALSISALLNFKTAADTVEKNVLHLTHTQKSGFWEASGFCIDPARKGRTYYAGSSSLTTAFCLEALGKYLHAIGVRPAKITKRKDSKSEYISHQVVLLVQRRFSRLGKELKDQTEKILMMVLKMDAKHKITLLPYFFKSALGKNGSSFSDKLIISLGVANTYGWMAYTIYDNFWDEEGDPKTLSVANIALRELTGIFHNILPNNSQFHELFNTIMDDTEWSNTWEANYCRIKISNKSIDLQNIRLPHLENYEMLARKSLGHGLGPLAMLFFLGYKKDSSEVKNVLCFFKHYLIARQLNDDAHDWEQDFKSGHINPVCAILIRTYMMKIKKSKRSFSLTKLIPKLQELFWCKTVVEVCHTIQNHTLLARKYLNALSIVVYPHVFEELLASLDQSAKKALEERENTIAFIDSYQDRI